VDRAALDRAVAGFADRVDVPATNGSVVFVGAEADPTYPQKGIVVDRARAARTLADAFLHRGPTVDLATHDALPTVTKDAVSRAMDGFANPAMSGPVVLSLAGSGVQVQPQEFGPALSLRPAGTRLVPRVDAPALLAVLAPKLRTLVRSPTDASFTVVAGRVVVVAGTTGVGYHAGDITSRFLSVVTGSAAGRTLRVPPVAVRPRFTTPAARRLGVTQLVSSFTTTFAADPTRTAELTRLAGLLDGTVLRPRQAFSLDEVVASAPVTGDVDSAVGQLAATTFNTAFFAGLRFVEHRPHPSYVARFPAGREATAVPGGIDLRFVDDTPYGVYVTARVGPSGSLRVAMYSTKRWNIRARQSARTAVLPPATQRLSGPGCVPSQGSAGFDVNVTRLFYRAGTARLDHRETMHTHYVPVDRVVCS
jgi:vancomycin resistance protein YoaR